MYHKVKRVYIAGNVKDWKTGRVRKRSGQTVSGVAINYEQTRSGYHRKGYTVKRGGTTYQVKPAAIGGSSQQFQKVIEVPEGAHNVHLYTSAKLPQKYQSALQRVR
jgi:hypothetical protein